MSTSVATKASGDRTMDQVHVDLEVLRADALRLVALLVLGVALLVFAVAADRLAPTTWVCPVALALLSLLVYQLSERAPRFARVTLITGLALILTGSLYAYPSIAVADAYPITVVLAAVLLGWRVGLLTAATDSILLAVVGSMVDGPIAGSDAAFAVALVWGSAVLAWLALRPVYAALDWSWTSCQQALQRTEELQVRQGELNRALRDLDRACYQLEIANEELARAREAAEEARRLKTELATSISHELRTPVNLIIGFSELMVLAPRKSYGESLPESYRGDIEAVYRNACHISNLVDDVLDLAQIDAHRMALRREPVSLSQIAEEATAAISRLFRDKGLRLSVELPADMPLLMADRTRVRQILINLLTNAARFTEEGGVTVSAWLDGQDVVIAVADTGPGLSPEDLPSVFQEFRQFHRAEGVKYRGSGLGLAVSKRFAELHGGNIRVESQVGVGTTFYVNLPQSENVASVVYSRNLAPLVPSRHPRTLLLVDERQQAARIFESYLDGYSILPVNSVEQARQVRAGNPVHALAVARTDREPERRVELHEAEPDLPVISYSLRVPYEHQKELGIAEYLLKPVSQEQLHAALRRLRKPVRSLLIVDDDPEMVRLLARIARPLSRGCQIFRAYDGESGLQLLREHHPDVLLLDILMPGVNGYDVLRAIRTDPDLKNVKTIVISARGHVEESVVVQEVGITRFGGLTVGEAMRCVQASLDVLLPMAGSAPAQPAVPAG